MTFATPWAFLLLLILPIIIYRYFSKSVLRVRTGKIQFSSTQQASLAGSSVRQRLIHLPFMLRILVLILLIIGLARPQEGMEKVFDISKGVAIEVVVDRSSSMGAEMEFDGQRLNRLEVAKKVFLEFVQGNKGDLRGRPNDLIGLITFARYADTTCPLTLAHGPLTEFIEPVQLVRRRPEDGTAIGDAIALAAARLQKTEETIKKQALSTGSDEPSYEIKSKIIILLTDGEQTAGKRTPLQAAKLAKEWGIKIYGIGIGGQQAMMQIKTLFGTQLIPTGRGVDQQTLKKLADTTGGLFRMAEDGDSLRAIYKEIDELEKSEIESVRYVDYQERFTPFVLLALVLLTLDIVLRCTYLRRLP
jgi:Ca-activated chloride channel family protein